MELQLDLSLGINHNPVSGFRVMSKEVLNSNHDAGTGFESKEVSSLNPWSFLSEKKRSFIDANYELQNYHSSQTLPLISWSGDDDHQTRKNPPSYPLNMNDGVAMEEEDEVVGWPPIKSWRKKVLHHHQQGGHIFVNNNRARARDQLGNNNNNYDERNGGSNSMYVKVKMEGVAIARKINLRLFHSYQTLTQFLINMFFPKYQHDVEGEGQDGTNYTLTYQDKDGDWLLAGDVPWQTFIESVKRLELQRNGG